MTLRSFFALLLVSTSLGAAELPPLGDQASGWATAMGHGAVATAEKRGGRWTFALSGQPFAAGHAEVAAQKTRRPARGYAPHCGRWRTREGWPGPFPVLAPADAEAHGCALVR